MTREPHDQFAKQYLEELLTPLENWQWRGQSIYYVRAGETHSQRPPCY